MSSVRVKVNQGIVRGCREPLPDGKEFLRFSGIPFAHPPIGNLRFRAPKKLEKFQSEEVDCSKERSPCYHKSMFTRDFVGSEDCLYLNVYVPELKPETPAKKLPVMFYIHGGGFHYDSSSIDIYSPEYLLMEDVIVVTVNYRLHILGFLCLPSVGIYGNAGLKDQQMALEWVYENIQHFGGDPENICVFGESAGAASVHLQVLNRNSRKMMKSAIMQSGCALGDWVFQKHSSLATRNLARQLGCPVDDDEEMFKFIMAATAEEFLKYFHKTQDVDERRRNLRLTFKPVIEEESEESFITMSPVEIIKRHGHEINIPLMFGTNDIDGIAMTIGFLKKTANYNNDYVRLLPMSLRLDPNSESAHNESKTIKNFYFRDELIGEKSIGSFVNHSTDYYFLIPQTISNELHAKFNPSGKQFLYEFRFDGKLNHYKLLMRMDHIPGASHADELGYLFRQRLLNNELEENSREMKMVQTMCKLWTNFAKYHEPTPDQRSLLDFKWTPMTDEHNLNYLIIDDEIKMSSNLHKNRMDFWRDMYMKYNKEFVVAKL